MSVEKPARGVVVNRTVFEMPACRTSGPLTPLASVARKSQGVREIVTSRNVGSPENSADDSDPTLDPDIVGGTTKLTVHAPFQANAGGTGISTLSTRVVSDDRSLYR